MYQKGDFSTAHGSMNHVAFNVPQECVAPYRKRLKAAGVPVTPLLYLSLIHI